MATSPLDTVFENQGGDGSYSVAWTFILSTTPFRNAERVGVWESVLSPLHISCYRSFDRSVEFIFEDELLDLLDTIRKYSKSCQQLYSEPNNCSGESHRVHASPLTPLYVHAQLPCLVCASYIAVSRIAEFLSWARSVSMVSLLSHASGLIGGRADERICIGRLTVDRVLIVLPVMAYSVGLGRPFQQANGLRLYTECTSLLLVAIIKSNPSREYSSNPYLKSLILFVRSRAASTFKFDPEVTDPDTRCRV